jgi:hypothetical protein
MGTNLRMMTKRKKTKKKRFDPFFDTLRHPLSPIGHLTYMRLTIALAGLAWLAGAACALEPAARAQSSGSSHVHDFVIFATIFTDRGFALPGARVRVRRSQEKKFRWESVSDAQGELALRVPQDAEYELTVEARGFQMQTRKIDAREGNRADQSIRMEPLAKPNAGPGAGGKS